MLIHILVVYVFCSYLFTGWAFLLMLKPKTLRFNNGEWYILFVGWVVSPVTCLLVVIMVIFILFLEFIRGELSIVIGGNKNITEKYI